MSTQGHALLKDLYLKVMGKPAHPDDCDDVVFRDLVDRVRHRHLPEGVDFGDMRQLLMVAREEVDLKILPPHLEAWVLEELTTG